MKKTITLFSFLLCVYVLQAQWVIQPSGSTVWFSSLSFVDENNGWITGFTGADNYLIRTTNGGQTWEPLGMPVFTWIAEVTFLNPTVGFAVGMNGIIEKSTDGGESWTAMTSPTSLTLQSVWFVDESTGWIVGENGIIFKSTNGGESWTPQTSGTSNRLIRVHFLNSQVGWACGWAGTILSTTDGGTNWTIQTSPTSFDLISISIVDENNVWMSGVVGGGGKNTMEALFDNGNIIHTADGGATWNLQYTSTEQTNGISFANSQQGWCFGSAGNIWYTDDSGATWNTQETGVTSTFLVGQMVSEFQGWATGSDGVIVHTTNGGAVGVGVGEDASNENNLEFSAYPNPVEDKCNLSFHLASNSKVKVTVQSIEGKQIAVVLDKEMVSGDYAISWDASSTANGIYFCTIQSNNNSITRKIVIQK